MTAGFAATAFLMKAKSKNARVHEISAHVKNPQLVKINPQPSIRRASSPAFEWLWLLKFSEVEFFVIFTSAIKRKTDRERPVTVT